MRAQIKMFESIGVLVVFFFLLVIGAVFYFNIAEHNLKRDLEAFAELKSIEVVERAFFLPELDCSFGGIQIPNCFDKIKLITLQNMLKQDQARTDYFPRFGFATIKVKEIYPDTKTTSLYENPITAESSKKTTSPVLMYDPITNKYAFGIIEVETYARE